eukprot:scaffold13458_cov75-Phaeocystis_antarctica.AAC.5
MRPHQRDERGEEHEEACVRGHPPLATQHAEGNEQAAQQQHAVGGGPGKVAVPGRVRRGVGLWRAHALMVA